MAKATPNKSISKTEFFAKLADETGLSKPDVKKVYDAITTVIHSSLGKKGPGILTLPGLFKLTTVKKPPVKGGKEVKNPFTGEMMTTKDKPASIAVRARVLKQLKGAVK